MKHLVTALFLFSTLFILNSQFSIAFAAAPAPLPQTGQTTCYDETGAVITCSGTGQDGEFKMGVAWPNPRFVDNGDQTVTDKLTGLIWSKDANPAAGTKTWQEALDYIKTLNSQNYQGHNDWRLPNINELKSLLNQGQASPALWLNGQGFSNVQSSYYWSCSTYAYGTNGAWIISMSGGGLGYSGKSVNVNVWPVRSGQSETFGSLTLPKTGQTTCYDTAGTTIPCSGTGQDGELRVGAAWPSPRFTDNADQTVTDNLTGLSWSKDANPATAVKTWQGALDYIKNLNSSTYLGHNDWRLPNIFEMKSLINQGQASSATWLNGLGFYNQMGCDYWSATTYANSPSAAWTVDIGPAMLRFSNLSATMITDLVNFLTTITGLRMTELGLIDAVGVDPFQNVSSLTLSNPIISGAQKNLTIGFIDGAFLIAEVALGANDLASLNGMLFDAQSKSSLIEQAITPAYAEDKLTGNCVWPVRSGQSGAFGSLTLSVSKSETGSGTITSNPTGLACDTLCVSNAFTYTVNTQVTLSATPAAGYYFLSWSNCDNPSGTTCIVTATSGHPTIIANFSHKIATTLSAQTSTSSMILNGQLTVSGKLTTIPSDASAELVGQTISVTITKPDSTTATFVTTTSDTSGHWSLQLNSFSLSGVYQIQASFAGSTKLMSASSDTKTILVGVTAVPTYAITSSVTGSGGSISCTSPITQGSSSTCTITPATGYALATLTDNSANVKSQVSGTSYIISNVTAAHTVVATFSDTTAPVISAFALPTTSTTLTVTFTTFTVSDNSGTVSAYCLTESNSSSGCSWTTTKPASYPFPTSGSKTLYAFAKDAAGNISTAASFSTTITLPDTQSKTATLVINTIPTLTYTDSYILSGTLKNGQIPLVGKTVTLKLTSPAGGILDDITVQTQSNGSYSFQLTLTTLDQAGDWQAQVFFKNDPDYLEAKQSTTIHIEKAPTQLTLTPPPKQVAPTTDIIISGTLRATLANRVTLFGLPVAITLTDRTGKSYLQNVTTSDDQGRYSISFKQFNNVTGTWHVDARFAGTSNFLDAVAGQQTFTVAAATGYAILIQGDLNSSGRPAYSASMDGIYRQLTKVRAFSPDNIIYLSPEGKNHANVFDTTTKSSIEHAITVDAHNLISTKGDAPLYIIMLDHGGKNGKFYIGDDNSYITPGDLNIWLSKLEGTLKTFGITLKTIIINGSCYSGSFVPELSKPVQRTIITSTNTDLTAAQGPPGIPGTGQPNLGDIFFHTFIDYLGGKNDKPLMEAFRDAAESIKALPQIPLYNGKPYKQLTQSDGDYFKDINFGLPPGTSLVEWQQIMPTTTALLGSIPEMYATTSGDATAGVKVWAEIKTPLFSTSTTTGTGQVNLNLPQITGQYNQAKSRWEFPASLNSNLTSIFSTAGSYTIFLYAADADNERLPMKTAMAYINDTGNKPPPAPQLQEPVPDAPLTKPFIIFRWTPVSDPDPDNTVTSTLIIYSNDNGTRGAELKRYELLPQGATFLDATTETMKDGTPLFTSGTYWWNIVSVDNKGASSPGTPRKFTYAPQSGLPALVTGYVFDSVTGAAISGATVTYGATSDNTIINGAYLFMVDPGMINVTITADGYQKVDIKNLNAAPGLVTTANATLTRLASQLKPGDCDGNSLVTIDEVQSAINMFLGVNPMKSCVNTDGGGNVFIDEVQKVINSFLGL